MNDTAQIVGGIVTAVAIGALAGVAWAFLFVGLSLIAAGVVGEIGDN